MFFLFMDECIFINMRGAVNSNCALLTIWEMVYSNTYFHFHKVNELTTLFLLG